MEPLLVSMVGEGIVRLDYLSAYHYDPAFGLQQL